MDQRICSIYTTLVLLCGYVHLQYVMLSSDKPSCVEHENITFTCTGTLKNGLPFAKFDYHSENQSIKSLTVGYGFMTNKCELGPAIEIPFYSYNCTNSSFSVTVLNVDGARHGEIWQCYQLDNHNVRHNSSFLRLIVKVPVQSVNISLLSGDWTDRQTYIESETILMKCVTSPGRPQPTVSWYLGESYHNASNISSTQSVYENFNQNEEAYNCTISVITLKVTRSFHNKWIFCNSTNIPGLDQVSSSVAVLNVEYPPNIGDLHDTSIIEGNDLSKTCPLEKGNPSNTSVTWTKAGNSNLSISDQLNISRVSRDNATHFTCVVNNTMTYSNGTKTQGVNSKSFYLNVLYPPDQFHVRLNNGSTDKNITYFFSLIESSKPATLTCTAISNPIATEYRWMTANVIRNASTVVLNLTRGFEGNYTCHAKNNMTETNGIHRIGESNSSYVLEILFPPSLGELTNEQVIENGYFEKHCVVSSGKTTSQSLKWIDEKTNTRVQPVKGNLVISNVTRLRTGNYTCRLNYTMEPTLGDSVADFIEKKFSLDVLYPPESVKVDLVAGSDVNRNITQNFSLTENTTTTLSCSASGHPNPEKFYWKGNLRNDSAILNFIARRTLNGTYSCQAENNMTVTNGSTTIGQISKDYVIDILYPPEIIGVHNRSIKEGDEILINCALSPGKTTNQTVMWITSNGTNVQNSNFTIRNATRNKTGDYTCLLNYTMFPTYGAEQHGFRLQTFYLDVQYMAEIAEFIIKDHSFEAEDKIFVNENDTVIFSCRADGNPSANVELKKGPQNLHTSNTQSLEYILGDLSCKDTGNFTCFGNNTLLGDHKSQNRNIRLFVNCSPRKSVDVQPNITLSENGSAIFRYVALAYPLPEFKWYKNVNGQLIVPSKGHVTNASISENEIEINFALYNATLDDYGEYILTVNNTLGRIQQSFFLINKEATHTEQNTAKSIAGPVAGGVIGGILGIVAVVSTVFIARKRGIVFRKTKDAEDHRVYQNVGFKEEFKTSKRLPALPPDEDSEDVHGDHRTLAQQQQEFDTDEHPYLNTMELIDLMKKVNVTDLFSYVTNKSYQEFSDEFGTFPSGLIASIPCSFASKPQNAVLNRYQGIYPYDHSRVIILGQPDFFINASYIDGNTGAKEYIASLGPTVKHTLGFRTFWNMVWHESSDVIVMLTNLQEPSGMKCEKYWADRGTTRNIGDFTIQSIDEEVAAEYKVRTFKVFKDDETRTVTQLHYTAWPDKKVPEDVTSLIEFRQRVKAAPTRSSGPLIVHCSAGVGRTGTYIALDRLIKEGKSKTAINVYDCVMNMRKQRVNMVQTLDQYVYLHQALVYCLVFDIEPVSSNGIDEYVKKTSNNVYSKLFQQLQQTVEDETMEEKEARAKNVDMLEKNRTTADIPSDAHRIRLFLDKQMGESDYINAVYLNGFKRQEHFIIAQSPLPTTLDDFVCLLYQATCCCIVSLDDYQQTGASNVTYLPPDNQPMKYGTFTISCSNLDVKSGYSVRKLKLGFTGKFGNGERIVYHFEFTGWKHDDRTPKDPKLFVDFIKEVDKYATELEDEHSHVLVHCMSGSERSGLFCAVYNLMDKMEQERQVSVVNMLRRVRARRRTAIPNMEQLKFCYQALNAFVKSYKI